MKLDRPKLQAAYIDKINKICDDREDKTRFEIPEIVSIIAELIESGKFYFPPSKTSVLKLCEEWKKLSPEWTAETKEFVDELYSRLEWAETEVSVLNARLNKNWTAGSNLYNQKEVDALVEAEYSIGYDIGYEKAKQEERDFIARCLV